MQAHVRATSGSGARVLAICAGLSVLATLCGCAESEDAKAAGSEPGVPVRVETVGKTDIADVLTYVVDLTPYVEVKLFSPVPDRILYFPWKDGDVVERGTRIALIRREGLDKGLEQMAAQLEALDVQIQHLGSELERSKELLANGVITRQVFDQVQTSYLSTIAQRKALEASKGQIAVTAGNAIITAPISGIVAGKTLEVGDTAAPQLPLCRILQVDRLKATLRLVEADIAKVHLGQAVALRFDAHRERAFAGKVTSIMPFIDPGTRTNTVEVTVDNPLVSDGCAPPCTPARLLKPGMFGTAEIVVAERHDVVAAPEPALLLDNRFLESGEEGRRRAFVVDGDGVARERTVKLGARKGAVYEVVEGLASGEQLVVRGQHRLKDGQKVEIVTAAAK